MNSISHIRTTRILSFEYDSFRPYVQRYFIRRVLRRHSVFLDPMAGTSPLIPFVEAQGYVAYLNDISPVHFYLNRAKQYRIFQCYKKYGYQWFTRELLHCMASAKGKRLYLSYKWIDDEVLDGLTKAWQAVEQYDEDIAIFLKAMIVISVRSFSSFTTSANPTWFKPGGIPSDKSLEEIIRESLTTFHKYYSLSYSLSPIAKRGRCIFSLEDAAELNLKRKVAIILISPPCCNRLDTIRQYGPELYFLSAVGHPIPDKNVIGTTKVRGYENLQSDFEYLTTNSEYATRLLNRIRDSSKLGDRGYYVKYYTRYFGMLVRVFKNLSNCLSLEGRMYIVVRDNTHRGQDLEIDKVLKELLRAEGWRCRVKITGELHHLGLKNPSQDHTFIKRKQFEKLMVAWR